MDNFEHKTDAFLEDQVRNLVEQGYGKVIIARKLSISEGKASRLIRKVKGHDMVNDPGIIAQVTDMVEKGFNVSKIEKVLEGALSPDEVKEVVSLVHQELPDAPEPIEDDLTDPKVRFAVVKNLMDQGYKSTHIGKVLGVSDRNARYWMQKVRLNLTRSTNIDKVVDMLDADSDAYDIAKRFSKTPNAALSMIKKAEGTFSPVGDWVKKVAKYGVLLSRLKQQFKVSSKEKALAILEENFPNCFIIETVVDDGDVLFTPVVNSKAELTKLDIDVNKRPFKVGIVSHNYVVIKIDDDIPAENIMIIDLTDIHVGAKKFRRKEFMEVIEFVRTTPGCFVLLGGDVIEAITKVSVGDPSDQIENLNEQVIDFIELVLPIADRILVEEWGNHCGGRTEKAAQLDLARTIATMLKVPYFRERVIIDVHWRGVMKRISLAHKYGKALRKAQIETSIERIMSWSNFKIDCFFSGHTHESFHFPKNVMTLVPGKGMVTHRYFICNGGSFLGRGDTYASREDYPPTPQDVVYYTFDAEGNDAAGSIRMDSD